MTQDPNSPISEPDWNRVSKRPHLAVLAGDNAGQRYPLHTGEYRLGRSEDSDIILLDRSASRLHAIITVEDDGEDSGVPKIKIEDLKSRNGTLVNGQPLRMKWLRPNDKIQIGDAVYGYFVGESAETAPQAIKDLTTDVITGLANKERFEANLHSEFFRGTRYKRYFALVLAEIDDLEKIDDIYGSQIGDLALELIGDILNENRRPPDVVARLEDAMFGIILPETPLSNSLSYAERLRLRVHEARIPDSLIELSATLAVVFFDAAFDEPSEMLGEALHVLKRGKLTGSNHVYWRHPSGVIKKIGTHDDDIPPDDTPPHGEE